MFSRASKPGEYLEGTTADRISNLTNSSSHNLDPSDLQSPGPGLATPPCLVCPANHLFGHAHLPNNPLAGDVGCLRGGGKGDSIFVSHGSPRGHSSAPHVQVLIFAWPWLTLGRTHVWGVNLALPVLSLLFFHCFIFVVVCVAMVVMQQLCNT